MSDHTKARAEEIIRTLREAGVDLGTVDLDAVCTATKARIKEVQEEAARIREAEAEKEAEREARAAELKHEWEKSSEEQRKAFDDLLAEFGATFENPNSAEHHIATNHGVFPNLYKHSTIRIGDREITSHADKYRLDIVLSIGPYTIPTREFVSSYTLEHYMQDVRALLEIAADRDACIKTLTDRVDYKEQDALGKLKITQDNVTHHRRERGKVYGYFAEHTE